MRFDMFKSALCAAALATLAAPAITAAQTGLAPERTGFGLKAPRDATPPLVAGAEFMRAWQSGRGADYTLYGGVRDGLLLGLQHPETYGGVVHPLSGNWGSSFEAATTPESRVAPRRYALTGRIHTAFSDGRGLSVSLRYQIFDPARDMPGAPATAYGLAAWRTPGTAPAPGYQMLFSYQHSPASVFGLALGREMESYAPGFDVPGNGPRQLTFTGQHWFTPSWALSYDVLSSDPGNAMRVQGLRLGVRYRF